VAVVLFTRDLRVHDHPALAEAARSFEAVVPLFVVDEGILGRLESNRRRAFLFDALADLRSSLRERGADLVVRRGDPVAETIRAARAVDARTVLVSSDASAHARRRERRLARERVDLRIVGSTSVVPPGELVPAGRDHYRVFTPYWRRWREQPLPSPLRAPRRLRLPDRIDPRELPHALGAGGETAGRAALRRWLARSRPDDETLDAGASSRLGPYLHFGCLSPLEVAARAPDDEFLRRLCWRDFFLQLLAANPRLPRDDLNPRGDRWHDDGDAFAAWRDGQTGFPVVDAAMRQLATEGWMPNRARLIVASFLAKTLYLDWRLGADVFSRLLADADVANNVGNWQWVAGTGTDTRPNRVLDPLAQARRFDPEGAYVRRHVPELAHLDGSAAHEPWKARAAGYPRPIADHRAAAAAFRAARKTGRRG
jgi:deoxyribodipyrimidine photo-lyase